METTNRPTKIRKVLFVHHVSEIGGASYCLLNIVRSLNKLKFLPVVLLPHKGALSNELEQLGIETHYCRSLWVYPYCRSLLNPFAINEVRKVYGSFKEFKKTLLIIKPDIVYYNNTFLFPYLKVSKKLGLKNIIHIREHWDSTKHKVQLEFIEKCINRFADRIIAINEYSSNMISADKKKVTIVHDWIDLKNRYESGLFKNILNEETEGLKVFVYFGGVQRIKGALQVLRAFCEETDNPNYRLIVFGISTDVPINGVKNRIKYLLNNCGLKTYQYKLVEYIKKDKRIKPTCATYNITDILQQAYCNLSYFTMPHANLALAESIIMKLPCLAAKTEESLEYTDNGCLAALHQINSYDEFVFNLKNIDIIHGQLKRTLNEKAEIIAKKFAPDKNISILEDAIVDTIK